MRFLTPDEVADQLRLKRETVWKWLQQGRLPYFKVGGRVRIDRQEFENWLSQRRVEAKQGLLDEGEEISCYRANMKPKIHEDEGGTGKRRGIHAGCGVRLAFSRTFQERWPKGRGYVMGYTKYEDIGAYQVDGEYVCKDCIEAEEVTEETVIDVGELERMLEDGFIECDRCNKGV